MNEERVGRRQWAVGSVCFLLSAFCLLTSQIDVEAGLTVSPVRVVHQAKPGKVLTGFFTLSNGGNAPLEVKVEPEDWSGGVTGERGPVHWLSVKPTKLLLRPATEARVKYTIRVPKEASGELRTQIFFTMESVHEGTPMRSRLGTIVYVGIEGTERIDAAIGNVSAAYTASTPGIATPDRIDVALRLHNRGNAHIVPEGEVVFRDSKGHVAATVPLKSGWGLLPNEEDLYHAIEHGVYLTPGSYTVDVTIRCGGDLRHPITVTKTLSAEVTPKGQLSLLDAGPPSP